MSADAGVLGDHGRVTVGSGLHDVQAWHCHTELRKLTIPRVGLREATLGELKYLERLGNRSLLESGVARTAGDLQRELLLKAGVDDEVVEIDGNLLMYGGASCQWQTLIGNGTASAGQALTFFNNAQAAIGVGDSSTAAVATHTNVQASTNKLRVAMDSTYPQHTDATTAGAASAVS
jgi:hypothetical protein